MSELNFDEFKTVLKNNPFVIERNLDITKLHVTFLSNEPDSQAVDKLKAIPITNDEFIFFEKWAKRLGYKEIMSSSQSNEKAPQKWHKKQGFKVIGKLKNINEDGSKEIFFLKRLK